VTSLPGAPTDFSAGFEPLDDQQVSHMLDQLWGVQGATWERQGSERDQTLVVSWPKGKGVLKISHPADDPARLSQLVAVLGYLEERGDALPFRVQRVRRTVTGELVGLGGGRPAHFLDYLEGTPLRHVPLDTAAMSGVGRATRQLEAVLEGFSGDLDREHPWALMSHELLAEAVDTVEEEALRLGLRRLIDIARETTIPEAMSLEFFASHNDGHGDNLLMANGEVAGVLDWGDAIRQPRVANLAVACSYARNYGDSWSEGNPWAAATALRSGYLDAGGPDEGEGLWGELVLVRLAQRIIRNGEIAKIASDGGVYARRNMVSSVTDLRQMWESRPDGVYPGHSKDPLW